MASCKDCIHYEACDISSVYFGDTAGSEKFREYEKRTDVERDCEHFKDRTRFVELPCKVGDKLFIIYNDGYVEYKCSEFCIGILQEIRVFAKCGISGCQHIQECPEYYCGKPFCSTSFILQDFGKTVFLTREEAERALKSSAKSNS